MWATPRDHPKVQAAMSGMDGPPQWQQIAAYRVAKFVNESREECWKKSVVATVMGASMGVGIGCFLGTMEGAHGDLVGKNMAEQLSYGFRKAFMASYVRSKYFAKEFAVIGCIFAGVECVIERERATRDVINTASAGGITGGVLGLWGARQMPAKVMAWNTTKGAAGFAAVAIIFDKVAEHFFS